MVDHGYSRRLRQQELYRRRKERREKQSGAFPVAMASVGISRKRLYSIMRRIEVQQRLSTEHASWLERKRGLRRCGGEREREACQMTAVTADAS